MEEILASIRRIISEDEQQADKPAPTQNGSAAASPPAPAPAPAAAEAAPTDEVLELTEVVNDDGSVSSLKEAAPDTSAPEASAEPEPEPFPEPSFEPEPEAPAFAQAEAEPPVDRGGAGSDFDLLSENAASSAAASFAGLLGSVGGMRSMHLGDGAKTLEDVVKELLRPMLKDWLDRNLPPLVERLVAREIAKIAGRAERD